jgi:hypothetical protein
MGRRQLFPSEWTPGRAAILIEAIVSPSIKSFMKYATCLDLIAIKSIAINTAKRKLFPDECFEKLYSHEKSGSRVIRTTKNKRAGPCVIQNPALAAWRINRPVLRKCS